ncbi:MULTISPECIES: MFS transporter [Cyanophyceae]|uniref:MFS transporter n=1 Tax=Cyanophyceae TaxID=3028117 RepID=UPI0018EF8EF6|nr:MFS transporter [Trichocoleus sp. FACHB-69]
MQQSSSTKTGSLFSTRLLALYIISFSAGASLGIFNPLISTFMEQRQIDEVWIGANSTVYFLTIALSTPLVEKLLRQTGIHRIMMFGLLLTSFSAPLFPMTAQLPFWFVIRIVMGFGVCCFLVSGQTALNNFSHESNRASVSGIYFLALGMGFVIGPVIGSRIYAISPQLAFIVGGGVLLCGLAFAWRDLPRKLIVSTPSPTSSSKILNKLTLPIFGVFSYGFAEATLITLYPVFLLRQNYSVQQMGYTFSVFVVGSILSTVPVTQLADRSGKVRILFISVCIGLLASLGLIWVETYEIVLFVSFLAGASIGPIYPLCLSLIGEQLSEEELPSGTALFTTTYSFGCAAGPILSSIMMETFGGRHLFSLCIPLYAMLLLRIGLQHRNLRRFQ